MVGCWCTLSFLLIVVVTCCNELDWMFSDSGLCLWQEHSSMFKFSILNGTRPFSLLWVHFVLLQWAKWMGLCRFSVCGTSQSCLLFKQFRVDHLFSLCHIWCMCVNSQALEEDIFCLDNCKFQGWKTWRQFVFLLF